MARTRRASPRVPPDIALLSLDRTSLRLQAAIGQPADAAACVEAATDRIAAISSRISTQLGCTVVVEICRARLTDPQSSIDSRLAGSPPQLALQFNQRLAALKPSSDFILFDTAGLAATVGQELWAPGRYEYTGKMSFSPDCVPIYAVRFATLLASLRGKSRRVLVLDLDNTLWSGVVGDDGVEGLVLGGNSALGKVHAAIQTMAHQYKQRGVLLCVASKNTHDIAIDAFRRHPKMILREEDITHFEINWGSKVESIKAMAQVLNLGLDFFVFVDDNPAERKQVRDSLPAVAVPELPEDPARLFLLFRARPISNNRACPTKI